MGNLLLRNDLHNPPQPPIPGREQEEQMLKRLTFKCKTEKKEEKKSKLCLLNTHQSQKHIVPDLFNVCKNKHLKKTTFDSDTPVTLK